jgi:hypothetical protein
VATVPSLVVGFATSRFFGRTILRPATSFCHWYRRKKQIAPQTLLNSAVEEN